MGSSCMFSDSHILDQKILDAALVPGPQSGCRLNRCKLKALMYRQARGCTRVVGESSYPTGVPRAANNEGTVPRPANMASRVGKRSYGRAQKRTETDGSIIYKDCTTLCRKHCSVSLTKPVDTHPDCRASLVSPGILAA